MRRNASTGFLLGSLVLVTGCQFVGDPTVGFLGFVSDTHAFSSNPNRPPGDSINMRRVEGQEPETTPLLPEPGNVWPGPVPPSKTLEDLQSEQSGPIGGSPSPYAPAPYTPPPINPPAVHPQPRAGSSTPPGSAQPGTVAPSQSLPPLPPGTPTQPVTPGSRVFQTSSGPAATTVGPNGVETFRNSNGQTGIVVPNGNGTSTLIAPDGSVQTVPNPR